MFIMVLNLIKIIVIKIKTHYNVHNFAHNTFFFLEFTESRKRKDRREIMLC